MTANPVAADIAAGAGPGGPRRSKAAMVFAVGFPLAAILTALALLFMVSGFSVSTEGVAQPASPVLFYLLGASLAIDVVLLGLVVLRIVRVVRAQNQAAPGAKLHLRFVALFSLAALTPAIVVALFMGVALSQGLDNWFNQRVGAVVERGAHLGRYMINSVSSSLDEDVRLMATDLNRAAAGLHDDPQTYRRFLQLQADGRSMSAAY